MNTNKVISEYNYEFDLRNIDFNIKSNTKSVNLFNLFNEIMGLYGFRKFLIPFNKDRKIFNESVNVLIDSILKIKINNNNLLNIKSFYFQEDFILNINKAGANPTFIALDKGDYSQIIPKNLFFLENIITISRDKNIAFLDYNHRDKLNQENLEKNNSLITFISMVDKFIDITFSVLYNYTIAKYKHLNKIRYAARELDDFHFKRMPVFSTICDIVEFSPSNIIRVINFDCFKSDESGFYCGFLEYQVNY